MGRLVDLYGPRRLYALGMGAAAIAGLVPLVSPTFAGALASRVVIGIGTSAAYPAAMAAIRDRSEQAGRDAPRALFSAVSVSSLVSAAIGPVLGGVLVENFGWQAIFAVNTPYALTVVALVLVGLPPDQARSGGAAGKERPDHAFSSLRTLAANLALVRTYTRLFLVCTCTYLVIYGLTPWLQAAAGHSADTVGWMQFPAVVLAGVAAALFPRTRGIHVPLAVAAAMPILGGLLLTGVTTTAPLWFLLVTIALFGPPQGLSAVGNQVAVYGQAPAGQMGLASGLSRTAVQIGAIAASAAIGPLLGPAPTEAGLHAIGWIIVLLATGALLLTVADPELRSATRPPPSR